MGLVPCARVSDECWSSCAACWAWSRWSRWTVPPPGSCTWTLSSAGSTSAALWFCCCSTTRWPACGETRWQHHVCLLKVFTGGVFPHWCYKNVPHPRDSNALIVTHLFNKETCCSIMLIPLQWLRFLQVSAFLVRALFSFAGARLVQPSWILYVTTTVYGNDILILTKSLQNSSHILYLLSKFLTWTNLSVLRFVSCNGSPFVPPSTHLQKM